MNDIIKTILEALQTIDFGNSHTVFGIIFTAAIATLLRYFEKKRLKEKITQAGGTPPPSTIKTIINLIGSLFKKKE